MKKHLLAIAALAAVSGGVFAQSSNVTMYGTLDVAVTNRSKTSSDVSTIAGGSGSSGSLTSLDHGGLYATVWGFRGSEDLGGGLKAGFNLEGYVTPDTGAGSQFGGLFGRAATISLAGSFGELKVGKQLDPAFLTGFAATDPRGARERHSGLISWATGTGANAAAPASVTKGNTQNIANIFLANAVTYYGSVNGLNVGLGYAFGEVADSAKPNSVLSAGANYSAAGFTVAGSYSANEGNSSADSSFGQSKRWSAGLAYQITPTLKAKTNYMEVKQNSDAGALLVKNEVWAFGIEYNLDPKNLVTVAYYDGKNKLGTDDTSKTIILSDEYSLSKRTTVYALVASHKGGSGYTNAANLYNTVQGETNTVTQVGIAHRF